LVVAIESQILEQAARERAAYMQYLQGMGLRGSRNPAVVDLGWAGNMQGALSQLLSMDLAGYYYATLDTALRWQAKGLRMHGYAGEFLTTEGTSSALVERRPIAEYLLCHMDASLRCFALDNGVAQPVFQECDESPSQAKLIQLVHGGILEFSRDLQMRLGEHLADVYVEPSLAESTFADYLKQPAAMDAVLLRGHYQEDRFGGLPVRWIVSEGDPTDERTVKASYWRNGARSLMKAKQNERSRSANGKPAAASSAAGFPLRLERRFVEKVVGDRKLAKYQRDRQSFFEDSGSKLARWWGRWSQERFKVQ
jgi:hypothetical protein